MAHGVYDIGAKLYRLNRLNRLNRLSYGFDLICLWLLHSMVEFQCIGSQCWRFLFRFQYSEVRILSGDGFDFRQS